MDILIKNATILPMCGTGQEKYYKGSIGISGSRIDFVSADPRDEQAFTAKAGVGMKVIDGRGKLVMPGLVNTHNHVSMSLMRSYADDLPLMKWLNEYVWPFESKLYPSDIRIGAQLGIAEMLLGGTTTFVDMYWHEDEVAEAVKEAGIRAVLSPTFTDELFGDFEKDLSSLTEKYAGGACPLISLMIAPHSVYTCSRENLLRARDIARELGVGINIHVSETMDEQVVMRERIDKTPIEYLAELDMLDPSTLVVHAVHVNESDMRTMADKGVSVAHNPHSNTKLSSGIAPVTRMLELGLNVAIGTDGPCSNNDLDMWDEARSASFLQKVASGNPLVLPAYEVLEMMTINGAKAIGLGDRIGSLEAGKLADIIILDLEQPHMYPQHDLVANLVYAAKSSDVKTVIVEGEIVVENAKTVNVDPIEVCHRAQQCVEDIENRK